MQGKDLSFNNIADADTAIECVRQFEEPACVIVKHANPCGVSVAASVREAYEAAYRTDPTSAFGGIIAFNRPLDGATAKAITDRQFVEVIAAPSVADDALPVLAAKPNVRVLALGDLAQRAGSDIEVRSVTGGLLAQTRDLGNVTAADLRVVTAAATHRGGAGGPVVRLARLQVREVERHRLCARPRHHRRGRRPDEPRLLEPARGHEGGGREARA